MAQTVKNESLRKHTTFRIGGQAAQFFLPETEAELRELVAEQPDAFLLGGGSNLLISDQGIDTVISTKQLKGFTCEEQPDGGSVVTVMAGHSLTVFAHKMGQLSLSGVEFGFGIPGSVGGAVVMNAGASNGEVKDALVKAKLLVDGKLAEMSAKDLSFSYRSSKLPESAVVVSASFALRRGDSAKIWEKMQAGFEKRKKTQPLDYPSAGSVFKNPAGKFAGKVIDDLGLKGMSVGGAQLSERHANFIVNRGKATAGQVLELIKKVEAIVLEKTGIKLEREVILAGSFT